MFKILLIISTLFFISGCSKGLMDGDLQANLEKSDKIYGRCNNPNRQFTKVERDICRDKERAAGPDGVVGEGINLTELIKKINNPTGNVVYSGSSVNQELWNGSLSVLSSYPLKTVDSQGGFISTEWILEEGIPDQRCLIKININSLELISTGVNTKIVCEKRTSGEWYISQQVFTEEEKQLTLKILEIANQLSIVQPSS